MFIATNRAELDAALAALARDGAPLALVPTMGALHDGHLSLVAGAQAEGSAVAVSIFVNPLQFDSAADLSRYPADHAADLAMLRAAGCRLAWLPDRDAMYPAGHATFIEVAGPAAGFEGAARPGHFRGVATVVATLFGQVRPRTAWFGEKDWQQLQVVRRMVADLLLPVAIRAGATRRDADGLAMSSRNRFLTAAERRAAPALHDALCAAATALRNGDAPSAALPRAVDTLRGRGLAVEYLALVDGESLDVLDGVRVGARLLAAARLGTVRLLDNIAVG